MKHIRLRVAKAAVVLALILSIAYIAGRTTSHAQSGGVTIFAVTIGNNLVSFDSTTPGILKSVAQISGLQPGETILGMDFRPHDGTLYALGSTNRLYTINTASGAAWLVFGSGPVGPPLAGSAIGFDFNPVADYIRVVTDADENLRLNPGTYPIAAAVDDNLRYAAGDAWDEVNPNVVAAAYTDKFLGTTVTTLLGIDIDGVRLVRQGSPDGAPISPNSGLLSTIGKLGVSTTGTVSFDIAAINEVGYASLTARDATLSQLFTINLQSGAGTLVGNIGSTEAIRDIAVFVPPRFVILSAAFGYGAASESMVMSWLPDVYPTSLAGITVRVFDSAHTERFAPLFGRVGPFILHQIPPGTVTGPAVITLTHGDGTVGSTLIQVDRVAPGIFMANGLDANYPAGSVADALALRVSADGTQRYEPVTQHFGRFVETSPIDLGPESDRVFLVLFATGLRFFSSLSGITATIGGVNVPVVFAGAHPTLVAVDQVNVLLPRSLIGRGVMDLQLVVDGKPSNTVKINVK